MCGAKSELAWEESMSQKVELALNARAALGEGAIWDNDRQVLYWVDILSREVHLYDVGSGEDRAIDVGQYVGTVVPRQSGGLMLALHHGFAGLNVETEQVELLADPEAQEPGNRFNDGKCDPAGRFWAGTLALEGTPKAASLYRLDPDLSVHRMLENVTCSNGIVWTADSKTMYYIDTGLRRVDAFDYDLETGDISGRRTAFEVPSALGFPDGSTLDSQGMLWVALWSGGAVSRWNPATGELLQVVEVPAPNVTSCAFSGPNLDQLYITTARDGLSAAALEEFPLAGGLFRADVGVTGVPAVGFAG
jgi:sugar lactone lactonase YvrE